MKLRIAFLALAMCVGATEIPQGPNNIVELQEFRQAQFIHIRSQLGANGVATLINLNPAINAWYLLKVTWAGQGEAAYHLENPSPRTRKLMLDEQYPSALMIVEGNNRTTCGLFASTVLQEARASSRIYAPLCEGRIYLRNPAVGHRTSLEAATDFLRDHVWGAEKIIAVGHILLGDEHRETGEVESGSGIKSAQESSEAPLPALVDPASTSEILASNNFGIALAQPQPGGMSPGAWYAAAGNPGVYASILRPNLISPAILQSYQSRVNYLDGAEASALCYLIAFDLDRFDLGYALGTEHPKVGWSAHIQPQMRDPQLPGPDGIGTIAPLIATGLIAPQFAPRTISAFTAGFKREHGAFKYGELALKNHGTHYGFIEDGVVFSRLQPGLSTVLVLDDGSIDMKTWTEDDNRLLPRIRHARQNGVPIVERDSASQSTVPGALVKTWGPGNWSGSEEVKLRTMRSGLAIASNGRKHFLIYAVFSSATPSAMARVFQAYRCDYAMLLDMNALEHTYLALYRRAESRMYVDHLIKGMSELDKTAAGEIVPRFLGYADNRDFFYVMRKEGKP
jgi:hypothetical protein